MDKLNPCVCGRFYETDHKKRTKENLSFREPESFPKSHPMSGVTHTKGYVRCPCGWYSPKFDTVEEIVESWNNVMR